jgi:hypothetical protein
MKEFFSYNTWRMLEDLCDYKISIKRLKFVINLIKVHFMNNDMYKQNIFIFVLCFVNKDIITQNSKTEIIDHFNL